MSFHTGFSLVRHDSGRWIPTLKRRAVLSLILKIKATYSSETFIAIYHTTWCHNMNQKNCYTQLSETLRKALRTLISKHFCTLTYWHLQFQSNLFCSTNTFFTISENDLVLSGSVQFFIVPLIYWGDAENNTHHLMDTWHVFKCDGPLSHRILHLSFIIHTPTSRRVIGNCAD